MADHIDLNSTLAYNIIGTAQVNSFEFGTSESGDPTVCIMNSPANVFVDWDPENPKKPVKINPKTDAFVLTVVDSLDDSNTTKKIMIAIVNRVLEYSVSQSGLLMHLKFTYIDASNPQKNIADIPAFGDIPVIRPIIRDMCYEKHNLALLLQGTVEKSDIEYIKEAYYKRICDTRVFKRVAMMKAEAVDANHIVRPFYIVVFSDRLLVDMDEVNRFSKSAVMMLHSALFDKYTFSIVPIG